MDEGRHSMSFTSPRTADGGGRSADWSSEIRPHRLKVALMALLVVAATAAALAIIIPLVIVFTAIVGIWLLWRRAAGAVSGWRRPAPNALRQNVRVIGPTKKA